MSSPAHVSEPAPALAARPTSPTVRVTRETAPDGRTYYTYERRPDGIRVAVWYAYDDDVSARRSLLAELVRLYGPRVRVTWCHFHDAAEDHKTSR